MERKTKPFEIDGFGEVRSVVIDGEPWFVGKDVAEDLGYKNSRDLLKKSVKGEDKRQAKIQTNGGPQTVTVINKSGLNDLRFLKGRNTNNGFGYVYAVEWGDGKVKIGSTTDPERRFKALEQTARYGGVELGRRIASEALTNYLDGERSLHSLFGGRRVMGTELFEVPFDEAAGAVKGLEASSEPISLN